MERTPCRVVRFRPPTVIRGIAIAGAFAGGLMLMFGLGVLFGTSSISALGPLFAAAWLFAPAALASYLARPQHGAHLEIDGDTLRFRVGGRQRVVRIGDVEGSYVVAATNALVLLLTSGSKVEVQLDGVPAEDVLRSFGLDLERRALLGALRGVLGSFTKGFITFTAAMAAATTLLEPLAHEWILLLGPLLATLATVLVLRYLGSRRVIVGADGLRVTGHLRDVFVPFSEIKDVTGTQAAYEGQVESAIIVERRHGGPLHLPTVGQSQDQSAALMRRIREGMTRFGFADGKPLAALERNGRSLAAWKQDLERLIVAGGGFRDQALGKDDLERVLVDVRAPAERRIGAALALRVADEGAAAQIRVAAETCANEELRAAFEEVADDAVDERTLSRLATKR